MRKKDGGFGAPLASGRLGNLFFLRNSSALGRKAEYGEGNQKRFAICNIFVTLLRYLSLRKPTMGFANPNKSTSGTPSMSFKSPITFGAVFVLPLLVLAYFRSNVIETGDWGLFPPSALFRQRPDYPANDATQFEIMKQQYAAECPDQPFNPHIFSIDPIIIYLENYMSYAETRYLKELG